MRLSEITGGIDKWQICLIHAAPVEPRRRRLPCTRLRKTWPRKTTTGLTGYWNIKTDGDFSKSRLFFTPSPHRILPGAESVKADPVNFDIVLFGQGDHEIMQAGRGLGQVGGNFFPLVALGNFELGEDGTVALVEADLDGAARGGKGADFHGLE